MNVHRPLPDRPVSYQDVLDAPEHKTAEIINGVFYLQAEAAPPHRSVVDGLIEALRPPFQRGRGGPGGWWIVGEPELYFGDRDYRTLVPDLAGWRRDRVPTLPQRWADLDTRPDWICEIVSPSTARIDRIEKVPIYAEAGVSALWIIDPLARTLEIFELREGRWTLMGVHAGEDSVQAVPFDTLTLALDDLWLPGEEDHERES